MSDWQFSISDGMEGPGLHTVEGLTIALVPPSSASSTGLLINPWVGGYRPEEASGPVEVELGPGQPLLKDPRIGAAGDGILSKNVRLLATGPGGGFGGEIHTGLANRRYFRADGYEYWITLQGVRNTVDPHGQAAKVYEFHLERVHDENDPEPSERRREYLAIGLRHKEAFDAAGVLEAVAELDAWLEAELSPGQFDETLLRALTSTAGLLRKLDRPGAEERAVLDRIIDRRWEASVVEGVPVTARKANAFAIKAQSYHRDGMEREAAETLERAVASLSPTIRGPGADVYLSDMLHDAAMFWSELGETDRARVACRTMLERYRESDTPKVVNNVKWAEKFLEGLQ